MGIIPNNSLGVGAAGTPPTGDRAHAVLSGTFTAVGPSAPFCFQGWANFALWASVVTTLTTTAGSLSASVSSGTGIAAGGSVNSANVPAGTTWATFSGTSGTLALPPQTYRGVIDEAGNITGMAATTGLLGATVTRPQGDTAAPVLPANTTVAAITGPNSVLLSAAPTSFDALNRQHPFVFAPNGNAVLGGTDAAATFTDSTLTWSGTVQIERSFDGGLTWNCCNVGSILAQYTAGPVNTSWAEPELGVAYRFNCTAYTSGTINYRMSETAGGAMSLTLGGVV